MIGSWYAYEKGALWPTLSASTSQTEQHSCHRSLTGCGKELDTLTQTVTLTATDSNADSDTHSEAQWHSDTGSDTVMLAYTGLKLHSQGTKLPLVRWCGSSHTCTLCGGRHHLAATFSKLIFLFHSNLELQNSSCSNIPVKTWKNEKWEMKRYWTSHYNEILSPGCTETSPPFTRVCAFHMKCTEHFCCVHMCVCVYVSVHWYIPTYIIYSRSTI